jgi:hypothetical protein
MTNSSDESLIRDIVKSASGIDISKRPVPKDDRDHVFSYEQLAKEHWLDIWKKAKEHFNVSFDWENNDPAKEEIPKIITIKRKSKDKLDDSDDVFQVRCQLWYAGGDWEYPSMYFKCQLIENSFYGLGSIKTYLGDFSKYSHSHVILVPPIEAGNTHLHKSDDGKLVAWHNDEVKNDNEIEELDPKKAWQWLEQYFLKMIKDHAAGKNISRNE